MSGPTVDPGSAVDRFAIADVLALYCMRLDEYDIDGVGRLFLSDGVMDQGPGRGGPIAGRDAIVRGMKQRQALFSRTHHQLGQSVVTFPEENRAEASTYVIAWHLAHDGQELVARLRYRDVLVKHESRWWLARRRSEALGVTGFDGVQWNWVARKPPEADA